MNYTQKGVKQKKKALQAHAPRWGRKFLLTFLKAFMLVCIGVGIIGISAGIGVFKGIIDSAPTIKLEDATPNRFSSFIYDAEGNQIAKLVAEDSNRVPVSMAQIPENMANAFVAIEDARFYEHNGIDIQGIVRAGYTAILSKFGRKEGASTITQQLIKNTVLTTWTQEKTLPEQVKRKIQEQYLAIQLERNAGDKNKILEQYMNTINLGQNTLGVQAASKRYFNKNVWDLTLSECAVIAGITQNPSRYNPISHPENNVERRDKVLRDMLEQGMISKAEFDQAQADSEDVYDRIQIANAEVEESSVNSYYVDAVTQVVIDDLIEAGYSETQAYTMLYSGGLSVYSAMDPRIQAICDDVCTNEENFPSDTRWQLSYQLTYRTSVSGDEEIVNISTEKFKTYWQDQGNKAFNMMYNSVDAANEAVENYKQQALPDDAEIIGENISLTPQPQISLTIEDYTNGYVVAMIGGRGAKEGSRTLNRATDVWRQPGSTFKVVSTYAPAIDSAGFTLADVEVDAPYTYIDGTPVSNWYNTGYKGICSLREGIYNSLNIVTVKLLTQITPQLGFDYLMDFGFTTLESHKVIKDKVYTDIQQPLALGGITNGVKNIELNAAYSAIANGGYYIKPKLYSIVKDHDGNVILDNTSTEGRQVIKPSTAYLLTDAMMDTMTIGTSKIADFPGMSTAGKSGTTTDYNDVWFAGYTPYYCCSVWTGCDNNTKLRNHEKNLSKTLWRDCMSRIHETLENKPFEKPAEIVTATVCAQSGKLPNEALCGNCLKIEYFTPETVPTEICDVHYQGDVCAYSMLPATEECPFKVPGILTMAPENERIITGQVNAEGIVTSYCPHDFIFMSDPAADYYITQQKLEIELRNDQAAYATRLASLQEQLQQAVSDKAAAEAAAAAAGDDATKLNYESAAADAQLKIDTLNAQITQLQTAQNAAVAATAEGGGIIPTETGNVGSDTD